jgi:DNA primase small subunit
MNEKGWKSADVPFDIDLKDIEHECRDIHDFWVCTSCSLLGRLPTPEKCPNCSAKLIEYYWICDSCLNKLKEETYKLYDLLENDLGIDRAKLKVHFSGNLGFHLIIEDTEFEELGQKERMELVDFIMLRGFRYSSFRYNSMYVPRERGWSYRVSEILKRLGGGDSKLVDQDVVKKLGIKIDAMVTIDLHRIFRLPDSLHDDTGLAKKECTELESCDPFSEAVVFREDPVSLFVYYSPPIKLKENLYGPFKKERVKVPEYVAVYLIAKGLADIGSG